MSNRDEGEHFDAVIIGSGFGGSINALRIAQAGRSVLVLERGRRYLPGEFPRDVTQIDSVFWRYPQRKTALGLYDVRFFSGIAAVAASGVGGGSLIYANIHIRPDAEVFDHPRWPAALSRETLNPYYDRVQSQLGVAPVPEDIPLVKRDLFRQAAKQMGRAIFDPDQAVRWETPSAPGRKACQLCTECEFGCQFGAKNTLDLTYLAQAEQLGAQVRPGCNVRSIEPVSGGYAVHFADTVTGAPHCVTGTRVVVSAGTLGTSEILLRSRDNSRSLPALSPRLGKGYSGNGDFLGSLQNSRADIEPWKGPDVTSVIRYPDPELAFTMAAPSFNHPVMAVLASQGQPGGAWLRPFAPLLWPLMPALVPWLFRNGFVSRPARFKAPHAGDPSRMTNLFAIGRDNGNGEMKLKGDRLDVVWNYAHENAALVAKMEAAMQEIGRQYGGTAAPLFVWNLFRRITTVHSLGGCHLSESPETGVVSPEGEVHGYPGLFVADGSVIPTSIGFHPVMTISAVSERIADAVVRSFPAHTV